ncbi:MAG TPA: endonuclease [Pyrinomonadaceae bacterium]
MDINWEIMREAAGRWRAREQQRGETIKKLEEGGPLAADTPERVHRHLERLEAAVTEAKAAKVAARPEPAGAQPAQTLVEMIGRERVMGDPDFRGINFLELALAVSRFVGRINIRTAPGHTVGFGTGFMVSPSLLLTNNHVLGSVEAARHSEVEFDYQYDRFGRLLPVISYGLEPQRFFLTSPELDYTLVAVRQQSVSGIDLRFYGWSRLLEEQGKILVGKPLNIIQHPKGEAKQIVLRHNQLIDLLPDGKFAHYLTDTEPGSSGSPVYNDQWEVVALHHSGVPKIDANGNYVAKDGTIWKPGMDADELDWVANEGVRVSSIVNDVKERKLMTADQRRLREELLTAEPLDPIEAARDAAAFRQPPQPLGKTGDKSSVTPVVPADGGAVTLTIPLEVTIRMGAPALGGGAVTSATTTTGDAGDAAITSIEKPEPSPEPLDPEVRQALADLEDAPNKKYYDEPADIKARDAYYEGRPDGLGPAEFYRWLNDLLTQTHKKKLAYKPNVQVYPWVDLHEGQPQPKLKSIYSGKEFDPAEFIESDFRIEQERLRIRESLLREATFSTVGAQEQLDLLESTLPYNCEHVVPQSWFGKKEPMRGDLHHLFACESGCNSFRGNIPYYEFDDFEETVREACGKREELRFEPSAGKGAVARATLYFLLRYPGEINATKKEYTPDRIEMILGWHKNFKVTRYERHRNAAIHEKQGNRNPLIDHPDWADEIDFTLGLG